MSISRLKALKQMRDNTSSCLEVEFRDMADKCSHRKTQPAPSRGDSDWYSCTNPKNFWGQYLTAHCCVNDCPLLQEKKNGKKQNIKGIRARKSPSKRTSS